MTYSCKCGALTATSIIGEVVPDRKCLMCMTSLSYSVSANLRRSDTEIAERKEAAENPQPNKHPLLNPDSKHYQMTDGVEAITRLEQMFTTDELATWAKITAMKYRLRVGHKDDAEKETVKIKTFEEYYKYLKES